MTDPLYAPPLRKQMAEWLGAIKNVDAEIAELQKKRSDFAAKIDAARFLLDGKSPTPSTALSAKPLREAILSLMDDGPARSANDIRRDLIAAGYDAAKVSAKSGHFYSLLKELTDDGKLMRDRDGRYSKPRLVQSAA
jgi:hypothetical protein